ncbi:MAG: hypothetical protein HY066_01920 [Betaproteobacteria bacterium]|nr:hypothetical protein [Betaproteobacteria bacterium]
MLVSSSTSQPLQVLLPASTLPAGSEGSLAHTSSTQPPAEAAGGSPGQSKDTVAGDRVTLTAVRESKGGAPEFPPVYAEIWKDGIKVAEIDIHGGVNSVNGLVASAHGTAGNGGPLLAARRAAEIIRSIGGEIRVGGQVIDGQTLDTRARLKMAYGA